MYDTAARVGNYLYVAGGRTVPDDTIITTVERYDPFTEKWDNPFNWTDASSDGAAFGLGDLLYLVGGYSQNYNTLSNITAVNTLTYAFNYSLPNMEVSRGDISAVQFEGSI